MRRVNLAVVVLLVIVEDDQHLAVADSLGRAGERPVIRGEISAQQRAVLIEGQRASFERFIGGGDGHLRRGLRRLYERHHRHEIHLIQHRRDGEGNRSVQQASEHGKVTEGI
jgi:hypothetical protein